MVGLHVLYYKIIGRAVAYYFFNITKPLVGKADVNAIHYCDFVVTYKIGIIAYAVWNRKLALEKVGFSIINTDIYNIICSFHITPPLSCARFGKEKTPAFAGVYFIL